MHAHTVHAHAGLNLRRRRRDLPEAVLRCCWRRCIFAVPAIRLCSPRLRVCSDAGSEQGLRQQVFFPPASCRDGWARQKQASKWCTQMAQHNTHESQTRHTRHTHRITGLIRYLMDQDPSAATMGWRGEAPKGQQGSAQGSFCCLPSALTDCFVPQLRLRCCCQLLSPWLWPAMESGVLQCRGRS